MCAIADCLAPDSSGDNKALLSMKEKMAADTENDEGRCWKQYSCAVTPVSIQSKIQLTLAQKQSPH